MIVLIDVDGVIAQFYQSMLRHVSEIATIRYPNNKKLNKSIKYQDIKLYWCYDQMPKEHVSIAREVTSQDSFWRTLPEIPEAVEAINKLHEQHSILFATHPTVSCPTWTTARRTWLQMRFPWVTSDSLIITAAKKYIDGDILIEDAAHNLDAWLEERTSRNPSRKYQGFLFTAPYNRNRKQYGWQEILENILK